MYIIAGYKCLLKHETASSPVVLMLRMKHRSLNITI